MKQEEMLQMLLNTAQQSKYIGKQSNETAEQVNLYIMEIKKELAISLISDIRDKRMIVAIGLMIIKKLLKGGV